MKIIKTLVILFLISINLFAWEVNTHRAINRTELENVENLNAFTSSVKLFNNYGSETFNECGRVLLTQKTKNSFSNYFTKLNNQKREIQKWQV